ncbi:MAG: hypothetical protein HQ534_11045 [Armatimonadetes bacterium]|nr:hypothetical protein [Armatimonadota bacterium]
MMQKIDDVLSELDEKDPGCLDKLSSAEVTKILVGKKVLSPPSRITDFWVERYNTIQRLSGGEFTNTGGNKLKAFHYKILFI